jgi:hypothetical protein
MFSAAAAKSVAGSSAECSESAAAAKSVLLLNATENV